MTGHIAILGVFVADTSFRADRPPRMGETILGNAFALGPGGKGSNQAVAAARAGGDVRMLTRLGRDTFADMARSIWSDAGVTPRVIEDPDGYTGAAYIFIEEASGDNAIIICPGVAGAISEADVEGWAADITGAAVFMTQLEQPIPAAHRALEIAKAAGVTTILNPAPAAELPAEMVALADVATPNESEAEGLTGIKVTDPGSAKLAAEALRAQGVGTVVITLGAQGVFVLGDGVEAHVPALNAGPVVETTGAGDAFNGAFAVALAEGQSLEDAARFGCATAAISVTRPGTAPSMPERSEIEALLNR